MTDHIVVRRHDPRVQLTPGDFADLCTAETGDVLAIACNVTPRDGVAVARRGEIGSRLGGRAIVTVAQSGDENVIMIAAAQARELASRLLTIADEIDGETPLAFTPPPAGYYVALADDGHECVWRESEDGDELVAHYRDDLADDAAWKDLFAALPRRGYDAE